MQRIEDIAQAIFRWYLLEAVSLSLFGGALLSSGFDRIFFLLVAVLAGTTTLRIRKGDRSGVGRLMQGTQLIVGGAAILGGAALAGLGGILAWAGGYGFLAALVLVPLGIGLVAMGMALVRIGSADRPAAGVKRPSDSRGQSSRLLRIRESLGSPETGAG